MRVRAGGGGGAAAAAAAAAEEEELEEEEVVVELRGRPRGLLPRPGCQPGPGCWEVLHTWPPLCHTLADGLAAEGGEGLRAVGMMSCLGTLWVLSPVSLWSLMRAAKAGVSPSAVGRQKMRMGAAQGSVCRLAEW